MSTSSAPSRWQRIAGLSFAVAAPLFIVRLIVDASIRMVFPFLPQLATAAGLTVTAFGQIVAFRAWNGIAAPWLGRAVDRFGQRAVMLAGLLCLVAGLAGLFTLSGVWVALPMLLVGLASTAFIPAQQAFVTELAPLERRGRALAIVDAAFATSGLVLMPLLGVVIDQFGARASYALMGGLAVVGALIVAFLLPAPPRAHAVRGSAPPFAAVIRQTTVQAMTFVLALLFTAYAGFNAVWGVWLNQRFGVEATRVGEIARDIAIAEVIAVIVAGLLVDRLGRRRCAIAGLVFVVVALGGWALRQDALPTATLALIAIGGLFEFTLVSAFTVVGDQAPDALGTMFSLASLGASAGLALGPALALPLFEASGLPAVLGLVAGTLLLAAGLARWKLR